MSNLGTIYELNLSKCFKNKYPVVYKNYTYYYYKRYGTDLLSYSRSSVVFSYTEFKKKYQQGKFGGYGYILVYVNKHTVPDFSFVEGFSHEELSLSEAAMKEKRLIDEIDGYKNELVTTKKYIESHKRLIVQFESDIEKLQLELADKQDKLNKFREMHKNKEELK